MAAWSPAVLLGALWSIALVFLGIILFLWYWHATGIKCDDCKKVIYPRRELARHQRQQCPNRQVQCLNCQQEVRFSKMSIHMEVSCPERRIECSRCGRMLRAALMEQHSNHLCQQRFIQCRSCSEWISAGDEFKHKETCSGSAKGSEHWKTRLNFRSGGNKRSPKSVI